MPEGAHPEACHWVFDTTPLGSADNPCKPFEYPPGNDRSDGRRALSAAPASELFSEIVLQHDLVKTGIDNQLLELAILLLQLAHPSQLRDTNACILLLPRVERGLRDTNLATYFFHSRAGIGLVQCKSNLPLRELRSLHGDPLSEGSSAGNLEFSTVQNIGVRSII